MLRAMTAAAPPPTDGFPSEPWRQATVPPEPGPGDLAFACPRCRDDVTEAAYGPCTVCRADLRARVRGEARAVAQDDYVPKLNVTPNAVALKD